MRQAWNDPLPDGIKPASPGMMIYSNGKVHEIRPEKVSPITPLPAPLGLVPLHGAMMALMDFCEEYTTNWTLGRRGGDGSAAMVCQISTQDGRVMSYAAMFELSVAIMRAIEGARVWVEQRKEKAA